MIRRNLIQQFLLLLMLVHATLTEKSFAQRREIDSILQLLEKKQQDTLLPYLHYKLAKAYTRISGDTAVIHARKAIDAAIKQKNLKIESESYGVLGTVEKNRGNYQTALKYHLQARDKKEANNDEQGLASTYNEIGIVYKKMKRWDEALENYKRSNLLAQQYNLGAALANTYNNIGTIYIQKQLWDSVMVNYQRALAVAERLGDNGLMATVLTNLGESYAHNKQYEKAIAMYLRCLKYDKASENAYGMASSYFHIGLVYSDLGKYDDAARYMDSANTIAVKEQLRRERVDYTFMWGSIEEKRGNYAKALELQRISVSIKDSILNEETQKQLSELQIKYETAKKEKEISHQRAELTKKNYIIGGVSGIMALGLLLGLSSYRRYKLTQQAKLQQAVIQQQELATKAVIEAEERERKRIASDLHDGVGQLMSAARMNLSVMSHELSFPTIEQKTAFEKALLLVDESCKEVRTVSHNIMPNALLKSGLTSAIREFIDKIDSRVLKINLYTDGINERLPSNIETVLYRVIQECVNNVIKHSGANQLDLTLIKDEEEISVTIEDNGNGFNASDKSKFEGIGLKNIQTRVEYLKGSVEWDTSIGRGTIVTINIPAN